MSRKSIEHLLASEPVRVLSVETGSDGLRLAESELPDLILLDIVMPDLDGFEVCRRIREIQLLEAIPILLLTSLNDKDSHLQGLNAGADDFITKPFDPMLLKSRIRTILRLNRYRKLLSERARFEWVIEHSEDGYLMIDRNDSIVYSNHKAEQLLGIHGASGTIQGHKFREFVERRFLCEPAHSWKEWPQICFDNPDGKWFLIQPESVESHAVWIQITTIKHGEPDRPAVLKLENVSESLATQRVTWSFHGLISHKLRTPLSVIRSGIGLLSADNLPASEIQSIAQMTMRGVQRLDNEISDILEYLEAPNSSVSGDWASVKDIAELVHQTGQATRHNRLKLNTGDIPEDVLLGMSKHSLKSIILELIQNAIKFHPENSPEISVTLVQKNPEHLCLCVADDGKHMPTEVLEKAWTPYFQGEQYFTGQMDGMGLGLSMVATLIWEAGGACRIYNRNEIQGIVVELDLPIKQQSLQ